MIKCVHTMSSISASETFSSRAVKALCSLARMVKSCVKELSRESRNRIWIACARTSSENLEDGESWPDELGMVEAYSSEASWSRLKMESKIGRSLKSEPEGDSN